jgi:thioredoxin reductase (NADPH)
MVLSYEVANYPGVMSTTGHSIARTMLAQAKSFGAEIISQATITRLELTGDLKTVEVEDEGLFEAPVVIIASGGRPRTLGISSEQRFAGKGISYCATCDGDFFTDKEIIVVGGGNSALEEAVSLTKYASKVTVLHVLDEWQAQPWAVEEAEKNPKVDLLKSSQVIDFIGGDSLERIIAKDLVTGRSREIAAEGAFIFIGYEPNTEAFSGQVSMNERGEIEADDSMRTNVPGVFVAGDSRVKRYRQITTAVSDGTIAALEAVDYVHGSSRSDHSEESLAA